MELPFVSKSKYDEVVCKLECLLYHATGGKLSKHTYTLQAMEYAVTDYIRDRCEDAIEDYKMHTDKSEAIKVFADRVKTAFYYEFDEIIPSIMADKIDSIVADMTETKMLNA